MVYAILSFFLRIGRFSSVNLGNMGKKHYL